MNNEIERYAGELSELRELRELIAKKQNYIEAKIVHFDSNIRMSVMSDFDRLGNDRTQRIPTRITEKNTRIRNIFINQALTIVVSTQQHA
jgi:hypothetical protein